MNQAKCLIIILCMLIRQKQNNKYMFQVSLFVSGVSISPLLNQIGVLTTKKNLFNLKGIVF